MCTAQTSARAACGGMCHPSQNLGASTLRLLRVRPLLCGTTRRAGCAEKLTRPDAAPTPSASACVVAARATRERGLTVPEGLDTERPRSSSFCLQERPSVTADRFPPRTSVKRGEGRGDISCTRWRPRPGVLRAIVIAGGFPCVKLDPAHRRAQIRGKQQLAFPAKAQPPQET